MQPFTIDTSQLVLMCAGAAEQVTDYKTGQPRLDRNGAVQFQVKTLVMNGVDADVIKIKVAGTAPSVTPGQPMRAVGLVVQEYEVEGKTGNSYRAATLEPHTAAANPERKGTQTP